MLRDISAEAVQLAMLEHDELGKTAFLEKYGFLKHRSYSSLPTKTYESKAIIGGGHGLVGDQFDPLAAADLRPGAHDPSNAGGPGFAVSTRRLVERLDLGGAHSRA